MTNMQNLHERLTKAELRIETAIPLAGLLPGMRLPDALGDFLIETSPQTFQRCFPDAPTWLLDEEDDDVFLEWVASAKLTGWLVCIAQPTPDCSRTEDGTPRWNSYYQQWAYGETIEDCVDQVERRIQAPLPKRPRSASDEVAGDVPQGAARPGRSLAELMGRAER